MSSNLEFIREYRGTLYAGDCAHTWTTVEVAPKPQLVFQDYQICTTCGDKRSMRIRQVPPFPATQEETMPDAE